MVLVTWHEANAYCRWLTRRLGGGRWLFRMPTEAEWEKAGRGPDGFDYGLGMELSEPQSPSTTGRRTPAPRSRWSGPARLASARTGTASPTPRATPGVDAVGFRRYGADNPYRDDDRNADDTGDARDPRGLLLQRESVRLRLAYREEFQPELSSDDLGFRVAAVLGAAPRD